MANTSDYKHFVPPVPLNPHYRESLNLILIETLDQLKESFKKGYVMAWDTETTGLNPVESEIVGFSYSYDGITAYYCPVKHFDLALGKPALDLFYQALKDAKLQLLYNARFDIRMMEYSGYDMSIMYPKDPTTGQSAPKFIDVMNCSWLSDTNVLMPSLKASTLHFLGHQPPKFLETLGSEQNFQYVPARQAYEYACFTEDTYIVSKHGLKQIKELKVGDLIHTSIGYKKLNAILPQGKKEIIKVTTPDHTSFKCTPDHKFAFQVGDKVFWVQAKDLDRISFYQFYRGGASLNNIEDVFEPDPDKYLPSSGCKIEYLEEEEEVFDLYIDGEHNFKLQCGLLAHNCEDAANTYNLFKATYRYYKESGLAAKLDNQCVYIIGQLEKTPLNMDTDYLVKLRDDVYNYVQETEQRIYAIAGHPFKIASNRELTQVFQEQGIDTGERTKAGDMKTSIELLNMYLRNHPDCELLNLLIEYKEKFKLYNSYLKTLVDIAKQQNTVPPRFSYKLQSVPCLTANNLVLIKDKGLVSIKEAKEQDLVWTQFGYKRVLWNNAHKTNNIIRVVFDNGLFIEGTAHHPVLVNNGDENEIKLEWATLDALRVGESVIFNHHTPFISSDGVDQDLLDFSSLLGFLLTPQLIHKLYDDDSYREETFKNIVDLKTNKYVRDLKTDELFSINLLEFITSNKPICWVKFLQSLFTKTFETSIARHWNDESDFSKFYIYSDTSIFLTILMGMLFYLGIPSKIRYDGSKCYLVLDTLQSLTLFKNIIVEDSDSTYLKDLFFSYNRSNFFIEYADSTVYSKEYLKDEQVVYDIEVEDVHEYVANGVVTHNTGRLSCITGDTLIPTTLGDIPIEELSLYEDGNEVFIDHKTTAPFHTLYMGEKECVQLNLKNNKNIICTLDHKFLNSKAEWVEVKDLKVGDTLLSVQNNELTTTSITNIIPNGVLPVYTLTVNHPRHQYLSNTLISHNCGKDAKNTYFAPVNLQCLEENTIIKTDRGNIPIKNVKDGDLIWTGNRYAPCKPLGSKKEYCYKIKTLWGEIEASLEHQFLTLNYQNYNIEWHTLEECIQNHYPIVRDSQALGSSFDDIYHHTDYRSLYNLRKSLSLDEYKYYLEYYKDYKFDIIQDCSHEFWNKKLDPVWLKKTVYDLYVPEYNQFTANGYIVHNSIPKPKSIKCYGRKATQEEIDQHLDVLGWMFSPDHPEWSPGKVVEGMSDHLNVRKAFVPEHPENGDYVVSIDMSAEELRIVTNLYSEHNWAEVINSGGDLHHANSDAIFGKERYTKETRKKAKCLSGNSLVVTNQGSYYLRCLCSKRIIGEPIPISYIISTPEGMCQATHFIYNGVQKTKKINFKDGSFLEATHDHLVQSKGVLVPIEKLNIGDTIDGHSYNKEIMSIEEAEDEVFDLTVNNKSHLFYANGCVVHNCAAFGMLYGQEAAGFQRKFPDMSLDEAKEFMTKFKQAIPNITRGQQRTLSEAKRTGTFYTSFGRPRRVKSYLTSSNYREIAFGQRTCYSPDTEFLTKEGWKLAKDIKEDTLLAYYDPTTKSTSFTKAGERIVNVSTESIQYKGRSSSWNVTPNHRMWIRNTSKDNFKFVEAQHLLSLSWCQCIGSSYLDTSLEDKSQTIETPLGEYSKEDLAELFGWILTEGSINKNLYLLSFSHKNPDNFDTLKDLIGKFKGSWYYRILKNSTSDHPLLTCKICNTAFNHWVLNQIKGRVKIDRHIPEWVFTSSISVRRKFIDTMFLGGCSKDTLNPSFITPSKYIAEEFQILLNLSGYTSILNLYKNENNVDMYSVSYNKDEYFDLDFRTRENGICNIHKVEHEPLEYSCFTVPSGILITRYNGYISYMGNCKNGIIQGTAADVLKLELVRLWDYVFTQYPEIKWICTIHDEINFSVPRSLANKVIPILVRCMTVKMNNWLVPLDCGLSVGMSLGDIIPFKYNFETKEFVPEWEEDTRKEKREDKDDLEYSDSDSIEEIPVEELDSKMFDL